MAISGPEALRSLDDAIRDIRREEGKLAKKLARNGERIVKLRESEAELFRQLADVRLTPEVRADLAGRLLSAEKRAHAMIEEHGQALKAAEDALAEMDEKVAHKAKQRRDILERLEGAQAALAALSDKIGKAVASDPAFAAGQKDAQELRKIAEESLNKTAQAETDAEEKGRPYREDPLFMYLWEAGYETRNYRANNLVRFFDGMVARLVRYHDARPNFAMLNEIPIRLREHAERQISNAEAAEEALDALENKAIDAAGGGAMRVDITEARAALERFDGEMAELEDARDDHARTLRKIAEGQDPDFEEANRILAVSLGQQDIQGLLAAANRTQTESDDALVHQITDVRKRIAEEEVEGQSDQQRLRTFGKRRKELEDIEWEFKKSRFDDPRSTFREDDLAGDLLGEFLRGAISATGYWDQWRNSQSWRPGTSDWGNSIGLPKRGRASRSSSNPWGNSGGFGGSSKKGGFSRPRTGSRGRRKSGGFKTGGGF